MKLWFKSTNTHQHPPTPTKDRDMSLFESLNGHYDEDGVWQRFKFCFVSCGDRCDCMPPNGIIFLEGKALEEHQERLANPDHKITTP